MTISKVSTFCLIDAISRFQRNNRAIGFHYWSIQIFKILVCILGLQCIGLIFTNIESEVIFILTVMFGASPITFSLFGDRIPYSNEIQSLQNMAKTLNSLDVYLAQHKHLIEIEIAERIVDITHELKKVNNKNLSVNDYLLVYKQVNRLKYLLYYIDTQEKENK